MTVTRLDIIASDLLAVEDWLRNKCEARHNDDMADVVMAAYEIIDDLSDEVEKWLGTTGSTIPPTSATGPDSATKAVLDALATRLSHAGETTMANGKTESV